MGVNYQVYKKKNINNNNIKHNGTKDKFYRRNY